MSDKTVSFYQHFLPPLQAGSYTVEVTHTLASTDSQRGFSETFQNIHTFSQQAERFAINPAAISSVFPPENGTGDFDNALPHVVFNNRTLPWARSLNGDMNSRKALAAEADQATWLAVFLFCEDDPIPQIQNTTIAKIGAPATASTYFPNLAAEEPTDATQPCSYIEISAPLFNSLAPSAIDLQYLAHVRELGTTSDSGVGLAYSIVVANRLPAKGKLFTAHLVSLEGFEKVLPSDENYATQLPTAFSSVRLITLKNWRFHTLDLNKTFSQLLVNLNNGGTDSPIFRCPASTTVATSVQQALNMGFTPFDHTMRAGSTTVSWYRGPLLPYQTNTVVTLPVANADALTRYNPETGIFDVSYAAAWQLGQLLALQSKTFSTALYAWRHQNKMQAIRSYEKKRFARTDTPLESFSVFFDNLADSLKAPSSNARKSSIQPKRYLRKDFFHSPEFAEHLTANPLPLPSSLEDWLNQLSLLRGVPFQYLVPYEAMLPIESIRFFTVDPNWTQCLLDGALSIGRSTSGDISHDSIMRPYIFSQLKTPNGNELSPQAPITGYLLRSEVIEGWPTLEAKAYFNKKVQTTYRTDIISNNIQICLIEGSFDQLTIHQPKEALHFGFDVASSSGAPSCGKTLRYTQTNGSQLAGAKSGKEIADITPYFRDTHLRTMKIAALFTGISAAVGETPFTSAEFALEMIEGAQKVDFYLGRIT